MGKDKIILTDPASGSIVPPGTRVNLEVSSGPPGAAPPRQVEVPILAGLTSQDAEALLKNAGLIVGDLTRAFTAIAKDRISNTAPAAGTRVDAGSKIGLEVSSGPAAVKVPDIVGFTQSAAAGVLKSESLLIGTVITRASAHSGPTSQLKQSPHAAARR
jgi:serine/threonine-protein kinase